MCGIAGLLKLDGSEWGDTGSGKMEAMMAKLRHRGPDSSGIYTEGPAALGVNRLSVVDTTKRADQPMQYGDGRYVIAFNGEIYNFRTLRDQLQKQGYSFATMGDTEVLLALYANKGPGCLSLLRGMFAFAIWDKRENSLFIARDRLGEKPLYYYRDKNFFAFASELPALLVLPEIPRKVEWSGIHSAMHFMHAIAPLSPFQDILKLPPAHYLLVSSDENHLSRYWQCSFSAADRYTDIHECALEVERCLDETVSLMCACDVPVGALLSGGLDSSCVVASMGKQMVGFPTFRISSLDDAQRDEFKSAQQVSQFFKTDHHEYHIESDALMTLAEVVRIHGEPVATAVPIDAFLLAKEMKKHVTVALCGAGGDEIFGGYREHNILHMLDNYFTRWRIFESTGIDIELGHSREEQWAWSLYQQVGRKNPEKVFASFKYDNSAIFKKIYSKQMLEIMTANDPMNICVEEFKRCGTDSLFDNFIGQQLNCVSQYSTTEINDRAGMSSSVEIRSPFLDVTMVELSLKIPPEFKVAPQAGTGKGKQILRSAMGHRLPSLPQSDWKTGFGGTTPYKKWLTEDHVEFMEKKLQSPMLADSGMFNLSGIQELFMLYQCGVEINWDIFIGLASTAIWLEEFF